MYSHFNLQSNYSPTSEDTIEEYYSELRTLIYQVPKHNVLLLCGDMNAQVGPISENHYHHHHHHHHHQTKNGTGELLCELQHSTNLIYLCTKFQNKPSQKWTFMYVNGPKAQLDLLLINKKCKNIAIDCAAYNTFHSVSSNHKIVTIKLPTLSQSK